MNNTYYEDSIGVRYVQESGLVAFDPTMFTAIEGHLMKPIHKLLFPQAQFSGIYY